MRILAIETSCDDTGVAILEDFSVLSNIVSSQTQVHKKYGGVYPALAKREHQKNLIPALKSALSEAGLCHSGLESSPKFLGDRLDPESRNTETARTLDSGFRQNDTDKFSKLKEILEREPELLKKLIPFLKKYQKPDIDLISVTQGPGLEPCLWVGVNFAKALSYFWDIPLIPVNHIESHILVNFLPNAASVIASLPAGRQGARGRRGNPESVHSPLDSRFSRQGGTPLWRWRQNDTIIKFPAVALVVSGGHTQLILMEKIGDYKILGETRDDAAGECFDKCAKIMGLSYPGGPIISKLAQKADGTFDIPPLPRPMINTKDYEFSFSGLKTAVLYADRKIKNKNRKYKQEMAREIQQAVIDVLIKKTIKAVENYGAKTLILGGGVSANQELRRQFQGAIGRLIGSHGAPGPSEPIQVLFPPAGLSTDNAVMAAVTAHFHQNKKIYPSTGASTELSRMSSGRAFAKLEAEANLRLGE